MRPDEPNPNPPLETRRHFIKKTGLAAAAVAGANLLPLNISAAETYPVVIVLDPSDPVAAEPPVRWAAERLCDALVARGVDAQIYTSLADAISSQQCVLAAGCDSQAAHEIANALNFSLPAVPESLALARGKTGGRTVTLAAGADARGLVYALLELADRVNFAAKPLAPLTIEKPIIEYPANSIRAISRAFASDIEDKPWFQDKIFWTDYFTMLAANRFNRFNLALGLGYDFARELRDTYFYFAYPFLLSVPGYDVRAVPLPDAERDLNLQMLRFASDEAARRGLHFQIGIWTHAFQWTNSPDANYTISGLTPATQAAYCRDALHALLTQCPNIAGVTLRTHGESGVPEGDVEIWKTIFSGIAQCGRKIEIDLHAKGIDQTIIDAALATEMPVNVSPKFWAEHMGLPYMQGAIRPLELPRANSNAGFFSRSSGARSFLRYGYGDLLREDRRYGIVHRIWPGTQRLLLWGDPEMAAGYGRVSSFCGSNGVEIMEPLFFKGRKGSGLPGGRDAYGAAILKPERDFEKYDYTYRVWGKNLYNPDGAEGGWRRPSVKQFGDAAKPAELALASASRILPMVLTAHCPSAANNNYWPEMYFNMAIVDATHKNPYSDTPSPKVFGKVSSLDPEFFLAVDEFADELLKGDASGKYSPVWVASQLEDAADAALDQLQEAKSKLHDPNDSAFQRLAVDVTIQAGLGKFFAAKFRAGVLYAIFQRTNNAEALEKAIVANRAARAAWAELAGAANGIYRDDITFGPEYFQRGHWRDRLPAMDADIADMEKRRADASRGNGAAMTREERHVIELASGSIKTLRAPSFTVTHTAPPSFVRNKPLTVVARGSNVAGARLRYRRVNQAEAWQVVEMTKEGKNFRAEIPAAYTDSPFPLQYHFQIRDASGVVGLCPGLHPGWQGQPYFIVRQAQA
jgi:hypothetical protein